MKITSLITLLGIVGTWAFFSPNAKAEYLGPCLSGESTTSYIGSWDHDNWYKITNHCSEIVNFRITVYYAEGGSATFSWTLAGGNSWSIYLGKRHVSFVTVTRE